MSDESQSTKLSTPDFINTPLLNAALAKAQGAMKNAEKDRDNPAFKSSYATLASTFDAVRKPLSDNGLSVFQNPETILEGSKVVLIKCVSEIRHSSGERLVTSPIVIPVATPHGAWQIGSAISYAKRYQVQSMLGIAAAEDDDDATAAQGEGPKQNQNAAARSSTPAAASRPDAKKQANDFIKKQQSKIEAKHDMQIDPRDLDFDDGEKSGEIVDNSSEFTQEPPPEGEPRSLLDQLVQLVEKYEVPYDEVGEIIKKVTGVSKKSKDLDSNQLTKVINFINLTKYKKQ